MRASAVRSRLWAIRAAGYIDVTTTVRNRGNFYDIVTVICGVTVGDACDLEPSLELIESHAEYARQLIATPYEHVCGPLTVRRMKATRFDELLPQFVRATSG